jgi:hypothetical protein
MPYDNNDNNDNDNFQNDCSLWGTCTYRNLYLERLYPVEVTSTLLSTLKEFLDLYLDDILKASETPNKTYNDYSRKNEIWQKDVIIPLMNRLSELSFHPIEYKNLMKEIEKEKNKIDKRHSDENKPCFMDSLCYFDLDQLYNYKYKRVDERIAMYKKENYYKHITKKEAFTDIRKWLEYRFHETEYDHISSLRLKCHIDQNTLKQEYTAFLRTVEEGDE